MKPVKRCWAAILALFYALVYLLPLNGRLLWQPDEIRYAETSREMLQRGDWIVPSLLGVRYFEKPVAGYWINNISQLLFGDSNFAVRFGVVSSTGASALLVYVLAMMMWNHRRTASLAALMFLSMLLVFGVGTYSVIDPMVSLWLTASMASFYLAVESTGTRDKLGAYILLGLTCGLGFMTKGFLALVVPVIAALPVALQRRRLKDLLIFGPAAVLAAIALSLPWALAVARHEPDYWHYFFWIEHIQRFADDNAQHKAPAWYYLPILILGALPWLALLPGSLLKGWRERAARPELFFLLSWVLMPLLFFSMAKGKLLTYILPCMAPLALLMAAYARGCIASGRSRIFRINALANGAFGLLGMAAVAALGAGLLPSVIILDRDEWPKVALAVVGFAGWVIFAAVSWHRGGQRWLWAAACPILFSLLVGYAIPQRVIDNKLPQQMIRANADVLRHSKYVLSNSVGLATAVAWELKRDDVKMYRERGELTYGLSYPDARGQFVSEQDFPSWLASSRRLGDVALILRLPDDNRLPAYLPAPDIMQRTGHQALVLYRQRP
ncbi:lipid IV(A) 4-amino-4-deoxy-L-arabinosyltransferase [Acerihabitans arboris]|uniref:Undecaprenyl phosphate-alpha-4-amino-4-deoxy-L-arabinose arabinosyl transferase n=1 Tax=Acerihabitans arboris TaxID=2691583 RepID=A0A845SL48_9GAMM|nr:lipid IV(A) 4-amino-4-deoxy-L-arabinosyltransferase [Acerihabitans arboris]NDL63694.1 lipid IV(A) 4-amino-4-deoxy-L-arabinosyltransferase [Acerihabitans arboris]